MNACCCNKIINKAHFSFFSTEFYIILSLWRTLFLELLWGGSCIQNNIYSNKKNIFKAGIWNVLVELFLHTLNWRRCSVCSISIYEMSNMRFIYFSKRLLSFYCHNWDYKYKTFHWQKQQKKNNKNFRKISKLSKIHGLLPCGFKGYCLLYNIIEVYLQNIMCLIFNFYFCY